MDDKKLQLCEDFLEFLMDKYAMFEIKSEENPNYTGIGDYINVKSVVKEYFTEPNEMI